MRVTELSRDQLCQLKQYYVFKTYNEAMGHDLDDFKDLSPTEECADQLARAHELVSDETIFKEYADYDFDNFDFFDTEPIMQKWVSDSEFGIICNNNYYNKHKCLYTNYDFHRDHKMSDEELFNRNAGFYFDGFKY